MRVRITARSEAQSRICMREGSRVAGGIYWKNQIRPAVRDNFVMLSDMFPTLCDLTAVPVSHEIDGISDLASFTG